MKPAPFEYHRPVSLPEAVDLLGDLGSEALPLAGGQSLVPLMNLRLARPAHVIDLGGLEGLRYIRRDGDLLRVGALTPHAEVENSELAAESAPLAHRAASHIGFPAIRHRGTVGGSVAHADPVAEWPCVCVALDGRITLVSSGGSREVKADDFFTTFFTTVRAPAELVTEVALSTRFDRWGFWEFSRRVGDFAIVAVAVALRTTDGVVEEARISLAGAGDRPLRLPAVESLLQDRPLSADLHPDLEEAAAAELSPPEDIHGSPDFRRQLVRTGVARASAAAAGRTRAGVQS